MYDDVSVANQPKEHIQAIMSETRPCKGYLVICKNPAVKGRLFCFTCAGRKSRNKKNLALETSERDVRELREKLEQILPEMVDLIKGYLTSFPLGTVETNGHSTTRIRSRYERSILSIGPD